MARGNKEGLRIDGGGASAEITNCVFTHNSNRGILNAGSLYTRQNNTLNWNTTDYEATGPKINAPAF